MSNPHQPLNYPVENPVEGGLTRLVRGGSLEGAVSATSAGYGLIQPDDPDARLQNRIPHTPHGRFRWWKALRQPHPCDYVLIDTQGAIGPLRDAAMLAADMALSPVPKEQADQIALSAMASLNGRIGTNALYAQGQIAIKGQHISQETWREALDIARDVTSSEDVQRGLKALENVSRQDTGSTTFEGGKQLAEQVRSHLEESARYQSRLQATRERMAQFNEAWSAAERMGSAARAELADHFLRAARQTGLGEADRLLDPTQSYASAQAATLWYGLVKSGADPVEAAEGALQSVFRRDGPTYEDLFSKYVAGKITEGTGGMDDQFVAYLRNVGTEADVRAAAQRYENEGPGAKGQANALMPEDARLGNLPMGMDQERRNHTNDVEDRIRNNELDIISKGAEVGEEADDTASRVEKGAGEGKANTQWDFGPFK